MRVFTKEVFVPKKDLDSADLSGFRRYYKERLLSEFPSPHRALRFVITKTDGEGYHCEFDLIVSEGKEEFGRLLESGSDILDLRKRSFENTEKFTAVLLIPTGVGAEIGGHCGDGNATARLIASACDTLITHPNVVNASDINEMTENTLYVEGSILTRLFTGRVGLQPARSNRILMLMDRHPEKLFNDEIINAVSSARITLGIDCDVHEMEDLIASTSRYSKSGRAVGEIQSMEKLFTVIEKYKDKYDAIALSTFLKVPEHVHKKYFHDDEMVNPWGGMEAMITHSIAELFGIPCAHSPMMPSTGIMNIELGIVDPRKAPESASVTYLHCILKGLHKTPRIVAPDKGMTLEDISCLIIPDGCVGVPTLACLENGIPVIAVRENKNNMENDFTGFPFQKNKLFIVDNYLEAVGIMTSLKAGVHPSAVRRPIRHTAVLP